LISRFSGNSLVNLSLLGRIGPSTHAEQYVRSRWPHTWHTDAHTMPFLQLAHSAMLSSQPTCAMHTLQVVWARLRSWFLENNDKENAPAAYFAGFGSSPGFPATGGSYFPRRPIRRTFGMSPGRRLAIQRRRWTYPSAQRWAELCEKTTVQDLFLLAMADENCEATRRGDPRG
jgi:hypothetical protein